MEIELAIQLKIELEQKITKLVQEYESWTGLSVINICFKEEQTIGSKRRIIGAVITCKL
jgi:uncharacterized protein (DUF2132 family)